MKKALRQQQNKALINFIMAEKDNERKVQRQRKREAKKVQKSLDSGMSLDSYNKIKAADEYKASEVKADNTVAAETPNKPDAGVTEVTSNPTSGVSETKKYPSMAEYAKANVEEVVVPNISGNDPKVETEKNVIEKATTYNEMKSGEALGGAIKAQVDEVSDAIEKEKLAIDQESARRAESNRDQGNRNTEAGAVRYSGDGSALKDAAVNGSGSYSMTDEEVARAKEEYRRQQAQDKVNAPAIAIEKMGIEHYYPPQQDFLTSNWSGRYIGSRQITAATGGLYPEGLLDARKRALDEKAKAKALAADKYWELTSTSPQYDERYKDVGMDILNEYYELTGGDVSGLTNGSSKLARDFQRKMYDFKSRGKMIEDVNTSSRALIATLSDPDGYVPPEVTKILYEIQSGTEDFDAYMKGETIGDEKMKKISNVLRSYQNFTPLADKQLELLKGLGANELPFAAGTDFNDASFAANAAAAIESVKHKDYDEFKTTTSKFFDVGEIETIVRNMYDVNNLYEGYSEGDYEEKIHSGVRYMMAMLPDKINIEQKFQQNKALGWASLAHRQSVWNTKKQWREQDIESMYEGINREMQDAQFEADMIAAHASSSDPKKRSEAISKVHQKYGRTTDNTGGFASMRLPAMGVTVQAVVPSTLQVVGKDGKQRSVSTELGIRWQEINKIKSNGKGEGDPSYDAVMADIKELNYVKERGSTPTSMNVGSRTVTMGYWDAASGTTIPLESYNGEVSNQNLTNTVHFGGQIGIETGIVKEGKKQLKPSSYQYVSNHSIENDASRRALGSQEGRAESIGFGKEFYMDDEDEGSSEGSGSSGATQNPLYE